MAFKIIEVISEDTIKTDPIWKWNNQSGSLVKINGYNSDEKNIIGIPSGKERLEKIVLNKEVELKNPVRITDGMLLCDIYLGETNIITQL